MEVAMLRTRPSPAPELNTSSPARGPIESLLEDLWSGLATRDDGELASYIPELGRVDASVFGLSAATLDGCVYTAGRLAPFTIQSVSKPFVYALALADQGPDAVTRRVGVEPTGDAFNTISLDETTSRPFNPMVNAGAIVTTSLLAGTTRQDQLARLIEGLSAFAGRRLEVDEDVFESERATGHRNRAIAHLLRSAGAIDDDVDAQLDLYFRQCSLLVTARDLSLMSATLANGGVNPVTEEEVVPPDVVGRVLTVMTTCGMYDYAGEWLYRVGLPAKSGVSGGIAAVLPGQLGVGMHSPLLDARGNSVRGIAACEQLSQRLGLHLLGSTPRSPAGVRRTRRGDLTRSKRVRLAAERALLDERGAEIVVHELTGDLTFASAEQLVRLVVNDPTPSSWCVIDLRAVTRLEPAAAVLLRDLATHLVPAGVRLAVVHPHTALGRRSVVDLTSAAHHSTNDIDDAMQWCEDELLRAGGLPEGPPDGLVSMAEQDLLRGAPPEVVTALEAVTVTRVLTPGAIVFDEGAPADGLWFVAAGQVSAVVRSGSPPMTRRLSTMGPGSSFGELALIDGSTRSTRVIVDEPTLCHVLTAEAYADLTHNNPSISAQLHLAIARSLATRLRYATAEITAIQAWR
jgi:glutaminase